MLSNAIENWYIILYDLFSRLWYIATCGPFCKDVTHIYRPTYETLDDFNLFNAEFDTFVSKISEIGYPSYICGNFNISLLNIHTVTMTMTMK